MANEIAPINVQTALRSLVDKEGVAGAATYLGISRDAVSRILAKLEVRTATVTHVRLRLKVK